MTLERLYRDFGADGDLTVAEYESMGGMAQIVQTEVDKLLATDPDERQAQLDTLHDAFIPWLATINPDSDQPMRRLARWDDLPAASHPLIQAMVEKRLLVKDTRDGNLGRGRAGKPAAPMARTGRLAARPSQDLKDADTLERAAADWQPAIATKPGCWKAPAWRRPKHWRRSAVSVNASTPLVNSCMLPVGVKTTA